MDDFGFQSDSGEQIHYGSICVSKSDQNLLNYELSFDREPIVYRKKPTEKIVQTQNVSLRYLRPPSLPNPGDIIVKQEPDKLTSPLAPLLIRRHFPKPITPQPCIYREEPPPTPDIKPDQVITIPGKIIRQPRKVITEHYFIIDSNDHVMNTFHNQIQREYVNYNILMHLYEKMQHLTYFQNTQTQSHLQLKPSYTPMYCNHYYYKPNVYFSSYSNHNNYHINCFNPYQFYNTNKLCCYYPRQNCFCS